MAIEILGTYVNQWDHAETLLYTDNGKRMITTGTGCWAAKDSQMEIMQPAPERNGPQKSWRRIGNKLLCEKMYRYGDLANFLRPYTDPAMIIAQTKSAGGIWRAQPIDLEITDQTIKIMIAASSPNRIFFYVPHESYWQALAELSREKPRMGTLARLGVQKIV